jgi:hypothetical protein
MNPVHPAVRSLFSFLGPINLGDFGDTFGSTSLPDKIAKHEARPVEEAVLGFFNRFVGPDQPVRSMDEASARATHILGRVTEAEIDINDKAKAINREIKTYEISKSTLFENKDKMTEEQFQEADKSIDNDIENWRRKSSRFSINSTKSIP